jgi:uncharacterized protein
MTSEPPRPPLPPFDDVSARAKVLAAENAWNTRDPHKVAAAYTPDTVWRNRAEFIAGRAEVIGFLTRKWERELDYALRKELWAHTDRRIAVRFQYEWRDYAGQWFRSYGNENWEFDDDGYMSRREASINDVLSTKSTAGSTVLVPTATSHHCRFASGVHPTSAIPRAPRTALHAECCALAHRTDHSVTAPVGHTGSPLPLRL